MESSETTGLIFEALTKAAPTLVNPIASETAKVKTKTGPDYSYKYPAFDQIVADVRRVLSEYGLAVLQEGVTDHGEGVDRDGKVIPVANVGVTTRIVHSSGEWIEMGPLYLPAGQGPQDYGSALTYARRYALTSALLLAAEEDDDAGSAQKATKPTMGEVFKKPKPDPDLASDPDSTSASDLSPGVKKVVPDLAAKYPYVPKDCPHLRWNESPTNSKFELCPGCGAARKKGEVSV